MSPRVLWRHEAVATGAIPPGPWVHEHHVAVTEVAREHAPGEVPPHFAGFRRPEGRVGTRNDIGILSSADRSATVIDFIADEINRSRGFHEAGFRAHAKRTV